MKTESINGAVILAIDDNPTNLSVLANYLSQFDCKVLLKTSGASGIKTAVKKVPDLILLDVLMPEMDGYETCQKLKANEVTASIPVIFSSALSDSVDKVRGFNVGAVDYITKPFFVEEVLMRIETHISLQRMKTSLKEKNILLEQKNKSLEQLNLEKNEFLGIVSHDLKNPLSSILGFSRWMNTLNSLSKEQIDEFMPNIVSAAERMEELINNLLDVNAIEENRVFANLKPVQIAPVLHRLQEAYISKAKAKAITLNFTEVDETLKIDADESLLFQVLDNLLSNAIKYSPLDRQIEIGVLTELDNVTFSFADQGPGITEEELPLLFQKFSRLSSKTTAGEHSTGLGLSIVKRLVEIMRGRVWCESQFGQGSTFFVSLPRLSS